MPGGDGRGPRGGGRGRGMSGGGRGMGRGQGMGRGRGMGRKAGSSAPGRSAAPLLSSFKAEEIAVPVPDPAPAGSETAPVPGRDGELSALRQQAEFLGRQLQQIQERILELERPESSGRNGSRRDAPVARVDADACAGCGICVDTCPHQAIHLEEGIAVIDGEICAGCGACAEACPREAISLS